MVNVCDIQVMKPLLSQHGFHFSKAKGQNFLIAPWVPQSIAEQAGVDDSAGVLEIGPGIGSLTQQLCLRAKKVCAVELDERLEPILDITVGEFDNLEIIWNDVLRLVLPALVKGEFPGLLGNGLGHPGGNEKILALGLGKVEAVLGKQWLHHLNITHVYHKKKPPF